MSQLQRVVQATSATAAHKLLRQKVNGKCTVVAYPAVADKNCGTLHYIACSDRDTRGLIEASLRGDTYLLLSPVNEFGDLVVMVALRPTEIAKRLEVRVDLV